MTVVMEIVASAATFMWDISDQRPKDYVPLNFPRYLKEYDPAKHCSTMEVELTDELADAKVFATKGDAFALWKTTCIPRPTRDDGKPNRPLSGFTVSLASASKT